MKKPTENQKEAMLTEIIALSGRPTPRKEGEFTLKELMAKWEKERGQKLRKSAGRSLLAMLVDTGVLKDRVAIIENGYRATVWRYTDGHQTQLEE